LRVCLLRRGVTVENFRRDREHRRHRHISESQAANLLRERVVEEVTPGVLRLTRVFPLRGDSSRFGEYLAAVIRNGEKWAALMRSDIVAPLAKKSFLDCEGGLDACKP